MGTLTKRDTLIEIGCWLFAIALIWLAWAIGSTHTSRERERLEKARQQWEADCIKQGGRPDSTNYVCWAGEGRR